MDPSLIVSIARSLLNEFEAWRQCCQFVGFEGEWCGAPFSA